MSNHRTYTDVQFSNAVKQARSIAQVFKLLNIRVSGSGYVTFKKDIKRLKLSTSHMLGQGWNIGRSPVVIVPLSKILVKNSSYLNTHSLKLRLWREGIKFKKCEKCGRTKWNDQPIPLELDHKNGYRTDHRLENLRILCPNCHAQTPTYCAKNRKKQHQIK